MAIIGNFILIPPDEWLFPAHGDVMEAKRRADEWFQQHGTYEGAEFVIEEFVRQWALRRVLDGYKYPREWVGERIVIEEPVKMGSTEKEADISIRNANRRTFLYVEVKKRGIAEDGFRVAERQLETYLASTHTATIGMVTDGDRVKTVRKKIDPNDFEYIADFPSYGLDTRIRVQLVRELPEDGDGHSTGLKILDNEYERVLFDCHSAARDVDGLHADEALDEICKVIYTKIYDERATTKQQAGTAFRFQTYGASNASEVASNIRVLYEEARTDDLERYSKRIPDYERSRGVFKTSIRLSDAALYRVVERLQEFSLIDSKADIKGRAFQKVLGPAIRAGMGQYFTPDPIVELAVGVIQPRATDLILDPFCGSGHFLTKALGYVVEHQGSELTPHDLHEFKFFHLHGIEKSDRMVRIAMTDMMLNDDGHTNIRNQDALLSFDNYPDIIALRDDQRADPAVFDVVLTNPPFGSIMRQETMEMLGRFVLGHKRKSLPLEILGLERSLQFLRPGGRMAIVLPEHLMKGKSALFVRKWLEGVANVKAIFFFPEEAFTPYGAMIKTCLCIVRRLREAEQPRSSAPTFLCEVENLGYDATGRPKGGSEVSDHCGRIPLLVRRGFRGEIVTTSASRELARLVLLDSANLNEEEVRRRARQETRPNRNKPIPAPLYTVVDAMRSFDYFGRTAHYDKPIDLAAGVRATFIDAGHILGSASVRLDLTEAGRQRSVLFSGDLGNSGRPLLRDPTVPPKSDVVVIETTYGDRLHKPIGPSVEELYGAIRDTFGRGGNVVIPTFALERAQEVLFYLREGLEAERLPRTTRIFLDSPMAISATEIFGGHPECYDEHTANLFREGRDPLDMPGLHMTRETSESIALNKISTGAVIMAGSGMCTGGRVRHHLQHNLARSESSIVFVGFAAKGTLARQIIDGASQVKVFGEPVNVRARLHTINGFSAHADRAELLAWHAAAAPQRTFLVHGEEETMRRFAGALYNTPVQLPRLHQSFDL